jgi:hypothetical protein
VTFARASSTDCSIGSRSSRIQRSPRPLVDQRDRRLLVPQASLDADAAVEEQASDLDRPFLVEVHGREVGENLPLLDQPKPVHWISNEPCASGHPDRH